MEQKIILYHGSRQVVACPEIRTARFHKDFYYGFYCTLIREQAKRWAIRYNEAGAINEYAYRPNETLRVLKFSEMTDDTIFNYVQNFADGKISREAFWGLATLTFLRGYEVHGEE